MVELNKLQISNRWGLGISIQLPIGPIHLIVIEKWLISDGSINIENLEKRYPNAYIVEVVGMNFEEMLQGNISNVSQQVDKEGVINKQIKTIFQ